MLIRKAIITSLFILSVCAIGTSQTRGFIIEPTDFNYKVGIDSSFYQLDNYHMGSSGILPFDKNANEWDFSSITSGSFATVKVMDPTTTPGASNYPGATGCSKSVTSGETSYMYELFSGNIFYWMGYYAKVLGFDVVGDYAPDTQVYHFPMQIGTMWNTTSFYNITIMGIPINVTETHQSEVVAEGKVKTPDIPYWMPCLVIKTFHTYSDGTGQTDDYWLYEWVVPNGFSGGNGVAACMSQKGGTGTFTYCRHLMILGPTNITPDMYEKHTFYTDVSTLSETGGTVNFTLDAGPAYGFRSYFIFGSVTGTSPGIPMPGGMVTLPVNWDIFTNVVINLWNTPLFWAFTGSLNSAGIGSAQLNAPALPPGYVGLKMYFAYGLANPFDFASNPVEVEIVP